MTTNVYDQAVEVISKPPPERATADLEQLIPWFRNKAELFGQMDAGERRDAGMISWWRHDKAYHITGHLWGEPNGNR